VRVLTPTGFIRTFSPQQRLNTLRLACARTALQPPPCRPRGWLPGRHLAGRPGSLTATPSTRWWPLTATASPCTRRGPLTATASPCTRWGPLTSTTSPNSRWWPLTTTASPNSRRGPLTATASDSDSWRWMASRWPESRCGRIGATRRTVAGSRRVPWPRRIAARTITRPRSRHPVAALRIPGAPHVVVVPIVAHEKGSDADTEQGPVIDQGNVGALVRVDDVAGIDPAPVGAHHHIAPAVVAQTAFHRQGGPGPECGDHRILPGRSGPQVDFLGGISQHRLGRQRQDGQKGQPQARDIRSFHAVPWWFAHPSDRVLADLTLQVARLPTSPVGRGKDLYLIGRKKGGVFLSHGSTGHHRVADAPNHSRYTEASSLGSTAMPLATQGCLPAGRVGNASTPDALQGELR
jgi:hypothetical protein